MTTLGLPHWLMIGGVILVFSGLAGFALNRNKEVETDPALLPSDINNANPVAAEKTMDKTER
jgi:MprA protease rhombosortase-interaction domain-containing protein